MEFNYPKAEKGSIVDEYFGHQVSDPYRWLEDPFSEKTKQFVEAQNNVTFPYLKTYPDRDKLNNRLTQLWNHVKYECPRKAGNLYFFTMNTGLQNQSVLYKLASFDAEPEIFIDPNELSRDGLISLTTFEFSEDGQYIAYSLSESGSDWNKIKIRKVSSNEDLPDLIEDVKYSRIAWTHDNKGFFYTRAPNKSKDGGTETTVLKFSALYYHIIGTDQSEDVLCVEFPDQPTWRPLAYVSCCGTYVFIFVRESCKNQLVYYCNLQSLPEGITGPLPLICLVSKFEAEYDYVTNEGSKVIFHTDKNAPLYRLVSINLEQDEIHWVDVIPEDKKKVLEWAVCVNEDKLLTCYIDDVKSVLCLYDLATGNKFHTFQLNVGYVTSVFGRKKEKEIFFKFVSFLTPGVLYHCDLSQSVKPKIFLEVNIPGFDSTKFETLQLFYESKDGTKIPMFIVQPKGFVKDGSAPAFLYGYGGFNIGIFPSFNIFRLMFVQHFGGILAYPNLRGGSEYGEDWHAAGAKFKKQNCFDDFQAAAEFLISNNYTTAKKIVINGASNGGLLIGACINQRPDLFGCAIAQVGVMDMLQYHKFTIGYAWKSDYCCSEDSEEELKFLLKISPLHNVKVPENDNVQYPSTLLLTADHDDRVVPLHSLKLIAELQDKLGNCPKQTNPIMIRVDTKSGHGAGKSTTKVIEELTDVYCFICLTLGLSYIE